MPASLSPSRAHWQSLQQKTEAALADIRSEEVHFLKWAARAAAHCQQAILELQKEVLAHLFCDKSDEIAYFKEVRPFYLSHILFYARAYDLEVSHPPGRYEDQLPFYEGERHRIVEYWQNNQFIYKYLLEGQTHLDDRLFFHDPEIAPDGMGGSLWPPPEGKRCQDWTVARLRAGEMLQDHIADRLATLRNPHAAAAISNLHLAWTDSKTGLIELAYAMHAAGTFNNGKVDLKEIVDYFQTVFHVQLGNYPRTFQEILSRKKGYTNCLDRLRDKLLLRIQDIEAKYER